MNFPISPSNLERRYFCPGSGRLEKDAPDTSSPAADRGTKLHEVMQEIIETGKSLKLERGYLPPEEVEAIEWCVSEATPYLNREGDHVVLSEYKLDLSPLGFEKGGTVDFGVVIPGEKIIFADWKFGRGYVAHPRYNWQFIAYAVGLWMTFGGSEVTAIKLQPDAEEGYKRLEFTFTEEELRFLSEKVKAVIEKAQQPDAPLVPGQKQCMFCRAKEMCPARQNALQTLPRHVTVKAHLDSIEPEQRAAFYENLLVASEWVSQAKAAVEEWAIEGHGQIPGWEIGEGRKSRGWVDSINALPDLRAAAVEAGKDPEKLVETSVISVAQAEKLLGKKVMAGLSSHIEVKSGSEKLVRV